MSAYDDAATRAGEVRITEQYLVSQTNTFRKTDAYIDHKSRIDKFDTLYGGDFSSMFPEETGLSDYPLIENKLKNATHDLARLANEASGSPVFMRQGEGKTENIKANVRSAIAQTIWQMADGPRMEMKLYMDLIAAGMAAVAVYFNSDSEYPQFLRLNPRNIWPDVINGHLTELLYMEEMRERVAARQWPDLGLDEYAKDSRTVLITTLYTPEAVVTAVCLRKPNGDAQSAHIVDTWVHDLKCVPVAFAALDSADETFHGLFDQLGGPLMIRNKIIRLFTDYLESLAHSPFEEKNIINAEDEPGPLTIYHHDPAAEESFLRRVQPAASSGAVFGMLQFLGSEEAAEAIQPPARVGVVSQSIASGSFVASTQGTLSSVVKELQLTVGRLRRDLNYIAFEIDERWLDDRKPMLYSIGNKSTYRPSTDMAGFYHHTIEYGAAAGLNRSEADTRVLQHLGARLISKRFARSQLDFVDDVTVQQQEIDEESLADAFFQRFAGDPNTPMSVIAKVLVEMGKGRPFLEVLEEVQPELFAAEQAAQQAATATPMAEQGQAPSPAEQQAALQAGQTSGFEPQFGAIGQAPLPQIITRNPVR